MTILRRIRSWLARRRKTRPAVWNDRWCRACDRQCLLARKREPSEAALRKAERDMERLWRLPAPWQ